MELLGKDGDETRLLVHRESGWSVALVGRPRLVPATSTFPRYDVVVALDDVKAEHGFRMDHDESAIAGNPLAGSLAAAFGSDRARGEPELRIVRGHTAGHVGANRMGGVQTIYPLREPKGDPHVEQLIVLVRGPWVLFHTTHFRTEDLNHVQWAHLRTATLDQYAWEPRKNDEPPSIWPASTIARPCAKLDLTDEAWAEAEAKAKECGHLDANVVDRLVELLREIAMGDQPPSFDLHELIVKQVAGRVRMAVPATLAHVLLRNVGEVKSMHDLRAWVWQCLWAVGNRRLYA